MKKIVMGAAALLCAASMFAVDFSSKMAIAGNLFNWDGGDAKVKMLNPGDWNAKDGNNFVLTGSASLDKAGATFRIVNADGANNLNKSEYSLWLQPIDAVKMTVGYRQIKLISGPNFGWWASTVDSGTVFGYSFDIKASDNLTFCLAMNPGTNTAFVDFSKTGIDVVGPFWADATLNTDVGSIQFVVAKDATVGAHGYSGWATSPLAIALAYKNMPYEQTGFYADAAVSFKKNGDALVFQGVDSQIGGQYAMDALMLRLTNLIQYRTEFKYGFEFKGSYKIDNVTPYIVIDGYDIMKSKMNVEVGVDTSVGACAINVAAQTPVDFTNYKFSINVPVTFTVNF